ncbi:MAG: DUF4279 domain-containing protein [Elusimicrobia bacterium]|nr:DUF4279 domain-containing protein [Elusimicrobiota bacterium]
MMREQTSVRFKITSATLAAAEIHERTGLVPDETWKAGDARGAFANVEKMHGFVLDSKTPITESLDDHVKGMIKRLAPHAQKIGALGADAVVEFGCIIHRKVVPALRFGRDDLRWLGVMGARLDVDIFILNDALMKGPATSGLFGTPTPPPPAPGASGK